MKKFDILTYALSAIFCISFFCGLAAELITGDKNMTRLFIEPITYLSIPLIPCLLGYIALTHIRTQPATC